MTTRSFVLALLFTISAVNTAHAQRLGPTTPWLGWRPISTRFGIHNTTMHIYPTYGDSPYISPGLRYEPNLATTVDAPKVNYGQVRVKVPSADAKVWFDGVATASTGLERLYYTPPLPADGSSMYRIRASWMEKGAPMVQEAVISVRPGETAIADFAR